MDDSMLHKYLALGLHVPGRYDKVLDIEECHICPQIFTKILNEVRKAALELGVSAYSQVTYNGFLRNLLLRNSIDTGELLVNLVTHDTLEKCDEQMMIWYENDLMKLFPEITSLVHTLNNTVTPVSYGSFKVLKGKEYITENISGLNFRISTDSFFQTNSYQLGRFVTAIIDTAGINEHDIIWDLYCGTGLLSLCLSKYAKQVFGIELADNSISDAIKNAELNNISNVNFFVSDLHDINVIELLIKLPKPDIIILDPPRAGMHKNLIDCLLNFEPPKIIYISCNPSTQARDLELFSEKYKVVWVKPIDMFPQTYHVESIALLEFK
jgi:23S rRNA (uracil1939-C5)-methyltransferase